MTGLDLVVLFVAAVVVRLGWDFGGYPDRILQRWSRGERWNGEPRA